MAPDLVSRFPVDDRALSELHDRSFGQATAAVTPWAQRLARYALTWIGAFDQGRLIGFVQVCWDGGAHAFLLDTAVDPLWRRRGVGTGLVRAAIADTRAAGCEWLHVDFEPHLTGFYRQSCGFTPTAAGLLRLSPAAG
jgi:GNAT superfamily N-acetyltransferase